MRAHAVSFLAPRRVGLGALDLPDIGPGQTLVRTLYSGISTGTELLAYRGQIDPSLPLDESLEGLQGGTFAYPFQYGYSCVGRVEEGDGPAPGTLVFAFRPHQDRFVASTAELVPIADVDPRQATLFPLVETAFQVALDAGAVLEEDVVVFGLGVVGLLTAVLLVRAGARVTAVDPRPGRRALAESVGLRAAGPDEVEGPLSLVIEASGNPDALRQALDLLGHEGHALVASWYGQKEATLPLGGDFHRRRLVIRSTQVTTIPSHLGSRWTLERRRSTVQSLLGELPLAALATHTFPFEEAPAVFEALDKGEEDILHAALSYEE
ncbi:MAG TPA: zinc-binding alcohol dehydrogenase [Acidimicrobiales bacterium]|nr:zinc-binding alcohol dehydrogenase [Acidimicrobiales bacterium]HWI05572.1 zinc-binding alcohol dehydrogenase [Acidimicrobiales bacterium]